MTTTISVILGNGAFLLRQISGPCLTLIEVQRVWPEARSAAPFFKNEWGDTLAQSQISFDDARRHGIECEQIIEIEV